MFTVWHSVGAEEAESDFGQQKASKQNFIHESVQKSRKRNTYDR